MNVNCLDSVVMITACAGMKVCSFYMFLGGEKIAASPANLLYLQVFESMSKIIVKSLQLSHCLGNPGHDVIVQATPFCTQPLCGFSSCNREMAVVRVLPGVHASSLRQGKTLKVTTTGQNHLRLLRVFCYNVRSSPPPLVSKNRFF